MTRKIVFLDIDGTLASMDMPVPASAVEACREARRQGHLLYIASGRSMELINEDVLAVGFDGVISSGGAHIETGVTGERFPYHGTIIFDAVMPPNLVKSLIGYLTDRRCGFSIEKNDAMLSNRFLLYYWENVSKRLNLEGKGEKPLKHIARVRNTQMPETLTEYYYEGVKKIVFVGNGDISFDDLTREFGDRCEIFRGSIPLFSDDGGEIGPLGIHKGSALERVASYHGASLDCTVAFGDSDNDRKMIERAGVGIAMGNAQESLKAIADDVTAPLDEDGVYLGFKKHVLTRGSMNEY